MGSWNYRVVRREYPGTVEQVMYEIHEAHYDSEDGSGEPQALTAEMAVLWSETAEGLFCVVTKMFEALDEPVLNYETREEVPGDQQ